MPRLRFALAVSACSLLALPAIAGAHPGQRGFNQTYPHASQLCAKVANGHAPKKLAASSAQVAADCAALRTSFTNALNAYSTTVAPLKQAATTVRAKTRQTCQTARANHTPGVCKQARHDGRMLLRALRTDVRNAAATYRTSVQAARTTFWAAIKALRGSAALTPDTGTPVAPTTTLPSIP